MKTNKHNAQWLCGDPRPLVSGSLETISKEQRSPKSLSRAAARTGWQNFSSFNGVRLVEDFAHLHFVVFRG